MPSRNGRIVSWTGYTPILSLDALHVKVKDQGQITNKAVYPAVGITMDGKKDVLGFRIEKTEGSKLWRQVVSELKNRGVKDIFIACVDGLKGFPEAIRAVFPKTGIQLCIVHMIRHSLKFVSYKDRKQITGDLKEAYHPSTVGAAEQALEVFSSKWGPRYPTVSPLWRNNWESIIPSFACPPEIRKVIYPTSTMEPLKHVVSHATENQGFLPGRRCPEKFCIRDCKTRRKKGHCRSGIGAALSTRSRSGKVKERLYEEASYTEYLTPSSPASAYSTNSRRCLPRIVLASLPGMTSPYQQAPWKARTIQSERFRNEPTASGSMASSNPISLLSMSQGLPSSDQSALEPYELVFPTVYRPKKSSFNRARMSKLAILPVMKPEGAPPGYMAQWPTW